MGIFTETNDEIIEDFYKRYAKIILDIEDIINNNKADYMKISKLEDFIIQKKKSQWFKTGLMVINNK